LLQIHLLFFHKQLDHPVYKDAAKAAPNYLMEELPARLKVAEVKYRISVQLAEEGDIINDPTAVWPDSRPQVELGVLTLKTPLPDSQQAEKIVMFSPLLLPDGIAPSEAPSCWQGQLPMR
jgi:catalase